MKNKRNKQFFFLQSNFNWITKTGAEFSLTIKVPDDKYGDWMFGVSIVANDNTSGGILFADCYSSANNSCKYGSILKGEPTSGDWNFGFSVTRDFLWKKKYQLDNHSAKSS